jgi:hypothetical protein
MARKRVIRIEEKVEPEVQAGNDREDLTTSMKDVGWVVWLKRSYLKYWYAVGCIFFDTLLALEILRTHSGNTIFSVLLLVLLMFVVGQVCFYFRIWKRPAK